MSIPKRKKSKARRDMRKSQQIKLKAPTLTKCPHCSEPKLPHRVCIHCGFYKGKEIITQNERR